MTKDYLLGIDEAGRGPLAGPVAVGAVLVRKDFDWSFVAGARDSKKMTPEARETIYRVLVRLRREGAIRFAVGFSSVQTIDRKGIVPAIALALQHAISKVAAHPKKTQVKLDGGLRAPAQFLFQETIIRGDDTEQIISLASIVAKVQRDRLMVRLAKKYPRYAFEVHKGYGTKVHRENIQRHGVSAIHRRSFCKAFQKDIGVR